MTNQERSNVFRQLMKDNNKKICQLAEESKLSIGTIRNVLDGKGITVSTLRSIALALDIDPSKLV